MQDLTPSPGVGYFGHAWPTPCASARAIAFFQDRLVAALRPREHAPRSPPLTVSEALAAVVEGRAVLLVAPAVAGGDPARDARPG